MNVAYLGLCCVQKLRKRGKLFSSLTFIIYIRKISSCHYGVASDYDEWAKIGGEGADRWAFSEFARYVLIFSL